jgi:hypothetical protein
LGEDVGLGTADSINKIIDVTEEDDPKLSEKLTEISKKHDAVLMACIAPYVGLKISPTKTIVEMTRIEKALSPSFSTIIKSVSFLLKD